MTFNQPDTLIPDPLNVLDWNRYAYARYNPVRYRDPSGHWIESALDIAFIAYDLMQINQEGWTLVNTAALTADIACAIVPLGTGGGPAIRALASGQDIASAVAVASKAAVKLPEAFRLGQAAEKGIQFFAGGNESLVDDLLGAANEPDRNGLTKAGRSAQKHGSRPGSSIPSVSGSPSNFNNAASSIVKEILSNPDSVFKYYSHSGYGNILDIWSPGGTGLRYRVKTVDDEVIYEFMNFLEPPLSKGPTRR